MPHTNYGLKLRPRKRHQWVMGQGKATRKLGADAADINPSGDWSAHDSGKELQRKNGLETMNCTSFATYLALMALAKFKSYQHFPDNCSERYSGIGTGTTQQGNDPWHVAETIAMRIGAIREELLPFADDIDTWDEYYAPKAGSAEYRKLVETGQELLRAYEIEPEWVIPPKSTYTRAQKRERIEAALKRGPVVASVHAWKKRGKVYVKDGPDNHLVWLPKLGEVRDQYDPFHKTLERDYDHDAAIVFFMRPNTTGILPKDRPLAIKLYKKLVSLLQQLLDAVAPPPAAPGERETPVERPPANDNPLPAPKDYIRDWALAIRDFEGFAAPGEADRTGKVHPEGSHSWRMNNPGNIKSLSGKFIHYETYEKGFAALEDYLRRACTGRHMAYRPSMTLRDFYAVYAPDGDKIIDAYTDFVAARIGATRHTVIATLA